MCQEKKVKKEKRMERREKEKQGNKTDIIEGALHERLKFNNLAKKKKKLLPRKNQPLLQVFVTQTFRQILSLPFVIT